MIQLSEKTIKELLEERNRLVARRLEMTEKIEVIKELLDPNYKTRKSE